MSTQKTPLARSWNLFAQRKALDEIVKRGCFLPGHVVSVAGQIVTVKFDVEGATFPGDLEMPIAVSRYTALPVQAGDLGVAMPSELYLGGVSGLGGGTADLTLIGNLSALLWLPVANSAWAAIDPNAVVLQAPNGVVLTDDAQGATLKVTPTQITLMVGANGIVIDAAGVRIMGKDFLTHKHTGVQTGGGVTGNVQ